MACGSRPCKGRANAEEAKIEAKTIADESFMILRRKKKEKVVEKVVEKVAGRVDKSESVSWLDQGVVCTLSVKYTK